MPDYMFRCRLCGHVLSVFSAGGPPAYKPEHCESFMARDYRSEMFAARKMYPAHYNPAVGEYVTSEKQFSDALKRGAEQASERTGIPHSYVPIHPSEAPKADEAREFSYRMAVETGQREARTWL